MKYLYTISLCLICIFFVNVSTTNAQLTPAQNTASKTQCPATCPDKQQCIKTASGSLECRITATDCKKSDGTTAGCDAGKVCVKAKSTDTKGQCVDDAPASAKAQSKPTAGGANTPAAEGDASSASTATNNPNSLKDGLQAFGSANSGLNTTGTLIGYIANIIRWILGILGTVFFIIIVIQGYLYMTAGGDSGKTASALGAIGNAVVGLLIIMGAFLITNFVTSGLINSGGGTTSQSSTNTTNNRR